MAGLLVLTPGTAFTCPRCAMGMTLNATGPLALPAPPLRAHLGVHPGQPVHHAIRVLQHHGRGLPDRGQRHRVRHAGRLASHRRRGQHRAVQTSGAGTSTAIPIAGTPLRLAHAAGATVATCTIKDNAPRSPYLSGG